MPVSPCTPSSASLPQDRAGHAICRPACRPVPPRPARGTGQGLAPWARALLLPGLFALLSLPAACSSSQPPTIPVQSLTRPGSSPDTMQWNFAPRALTLHIKADPELNQADDQAHTLRLVVYQLESTRAFDELAATKEGLATLMLCQRFDPSVRDMTSRIITPGLVETRVLDRAEGARYVGIVAGYSSLEPGLVSRTWAVPAAMHEEGSLFWKETWYYPAPLEMILLLGPSSLQRPTLAAGEQ